MRALPPGFVDRETALDFGVGVGRIAFPLAERFTQVIGVDVSKVMIAKLRLEAGERRHERVRGFHIDEDWDGQRTDFVYSVLTFQHMPDDEVRRALERLRRVTGGVGYFQFDTRTPRLFDVTRLMPDGLLPWTWRSGMRRIARSSAVVRAWLADAGFAIMKEFQPDSPLHGFLVGGGPEPTRPVES